MAKDADFLPDENLIREVVAEEVKAEDDVVDTADLAPPTGKRDPMVIPYRRIRDQSKMYPAMGGSVAGDIIGCGFACNQCWSTYGLAGKDRMQWLHADEAAAKLIAAARSGDRKIVRISHGEPFLYPEHVFSVVEQILAADLPQLPVVQIETNGLHATPELLDRLNDLGERFPDEKGHFEGAAPSRIGMWWSMKSSIEAMWVWHTGRSVEDNQTMFANWQHAIEACDQLWVATAVYRFLETEESEELLKEYLYEFGMEDFLYFETLKTYFPYERDIDRRMGARRLKAYTEMAREDEELEDPLKIPKSSVLSAPHIMGNGFAPPFPKPRRK